MRVRQAKKLDLSKPLKGTRAEQLERELDERIAVPQPRAVPLQPTPAMALRELEWLQVRIAHLRTERDRWRRRMSTPHLAGMAQTETAERDRKLSELLERQSRLAAIINGSRKDG